MSDKVVGFLGILAVIGGLALSVAIYLVRGGLEATGSLEFELAIGGCMLIVLAGGILGWTSQKRVPGRVAAIMAAAVLGLYTAQRVPTHEGVRPAAVPAAAPSVDAASADGESDQLDSPSNPTLGKL